MEEIAVIFGGKSVKVRQQIIIIVMPIIEIILKTEKLFSCFKIKNAKKKPINTETKNVKMSITRIDFCEIAV